MRNIIRIWISLHIYLFSSCTHKESIVLSPKLLQAEFVMYEHPDSALTILEQAQYPTQPNNLQYATWCLLITQARYKNYIEQPSDELIDVALEYFIKSDNAQRKALVLYLKGGLSQERGNVEEAANFFIKAAKEVELTKDYQLGHLIHSSIGSIHLYRTLYDYAMQAFQKSYHYSKLAKSDTYIANSLSYIARVYSAENKWDEAIEQYTEALHIANTSHNARIQSRIQNELSAIYIQIDNYTLALEYAKKALAIKGSIEMEQELLSIGEIYRLTNRVDSAYSYLGKAAYSNNIYTSRSAYQGLYYLSREEKNYKRAIDYNEKYWACRDSIKLISHTKDIAEIQEKYNQEKILNEKRQLQIEKDRMVRNALLGTILLLCFMAILIYSYQRKLIQRKRTIQEHKELIRLYTLKIHENDSLISRNQSRIKMLTSQIEEEREIHDQLEEQESALSEIQQQNEILLRENQILQMNISKYSSTPQEKAKELNTLKMLSEENLHLREREKFLCNQLLKKTEILNTLRKFPSYLDDSDWEEILDIINWIYENFTERLNKQLPSITEHDLKLCSLIKLHLTIPDISILLGISPTSVSQRKLRLKKRIVQDLNIDLNGNQALDLWLWEF